MISEARKIPWVQGLFKNLKDFITVWAKINIANTASTLIY